MTRREFLFVSGSGAAAGLAGLPLSASAAEGAGSNRFPKVPDVTKHVAEFATGTRYEDLPEGVLSLGKKSILDGFGLALASGRSKGSELLLAYIRTFGMNDAGATVLGTPYSLPVRFAALANDVAIHMEDFDDTQLAVAKDRVYGLLTHPTVTVLPAALGLAESGHRSGKELMLAYHVGVEVECKLAEASSPRSYGDGFHSTGVFGAFGSAVAAAKMKGLDLKRTMRAIAIAATHAGGLRENFGTLCKPLQAGQGAEAGVVAADLAAAGWDGAETIVEANNGFFHAFAGSYDPQALVGKLGSPWTFSSPGIVSVTVGGPFVSRRALEPESHLGAIVVDIDSVALADKGAREKVRVAEGPFQM